ncbi:MAG: glycosyl hydrolase family 18 protein [Candidatus Edwardsbacteria bacterium]
MKKLKKLGRNVIASRSLALVRDKLFAIVVFVMLSGSEISRFEVLRLQLRMTLPLLLFSFSLVWADSLREVKIPGFKSIHQAELEANRELSIPPETFFPTRILRARVPVVSQEVFGFLPYWRTTTSYTDKLHYNLLTTIVCFSVELAADGSIKDSHNYPSRWDNVRAHTHKNGGRVVLCATCFDSDTIHSILTTGSTNAINTLYNLVSSAGDDGVNIDFEGVYGSDKSNLSHFMTNLTEKFHTGIPGSFVTICTPAVDWNNAFSYKTLSDSTDGLFIMAYDYYWSGSSIAGPVAPLNSSSLWGTYSVQWTIDDYLYWSGGNRDKLILGCPYYGYDWPTEADTAHSQTTGSATSRTFAVAETCAQKYGEKWDVPSTTIWYAYQPSGWRQCWYDNETSLSAKYDSVNLNNLLGTGMWALTYDDFRPELWVALQSHFNIPLDSLANGNMENWQLDTVIVPIDTIINPSNWILGENADWVRSIIVHSGSYSLRHIVNSFGEPYPVPSVIYQDVKVTSGEYYNFSGWGRKNDSLANRMKLSVLWFDDYHQVMGQNDSPVITIDDTLYYFLSTGDVMAPGGVSFARLRLYIGGYGSWDRWDDVSFVKVPVGLEETTTINYQPSTINYQLYQNYPNPFSSQTAIRYSLSAMSHEPRAISHTTLKIYNIAGQLVKTLVDEQRIANSEQRVIWDGTDESGKRVADGVYFYQLRIGRSGILPDIIETKKMILLR